MIRRLTEAVRKVSRRGCDTAPRTETITIGSARLELDTRWPHDRSYLEWFANGSLTTTIAFDVLTARTFTKPGDVVLDAGANIGFTALLFLEAGARVIHAVEPDPRNLRRLVALQSEALRTYGFALAAQPAKETTLFMSTSHNQGSSLKSSWPLRFPPVFQRRLLASVETQTVDSVFSRVAFDLLKIDVEGAEADLLRGAADLFTQRPPRVVIVESYSDLFPRVHDLLGRVYPYHARLAVDLDRDSLIFLSTNDVTIPDASIAVEPPTYVYSRMRLPGNGATESIHISARPLAR